jgi:lipid kinase YegS
LAGEGVEVVVAAGGDGTLNETVNGLLLGRDKAPCALGVLPYGTANDFAAACGVPLGDPVAALRLAATVEPTRIDVGRAGDRLFVNLASAGYAAQVTTDTAPEAKHILGGFAYLLTGIAGMSAEVAQPVRLRAPDFQWEGEVFGVLVGNGRQAGGGFCVAPDALLDDGLLDVTIVPAVPWTEFAALANELRHLEDHPPLRYVLSRQCPWLEIEAPDGLQVNADGEPLRADSFRFEILPRILPCCLPTTAPLGRDD